MKFSDQLQQALLDEVMGVPGYSGWFEADGPPEVKIKTNVVGDWIWIHSVADYEGVTHDRTSGASGDPYSAHVIRDWIGKAASAPNIVSSIEELDKWALIHTICKRQYTDVGVWGVQEGRWIDNISPDCIVTFRIVSASRFQDVSPESQASPNDADLSLFEVISFDSLIKLLEHENEFLREMAANQLGKFGDTRAVDPFLFKAIKDESSYVREAAIEALGKLGGEKAIECLISIIIESSRYVHETPKRALISVGEPALPFLAPRITSEEEFVSIAIIGIIEQIGGTQSGQVLVAALVEKRPAVRARIIEALPKFGDLQVFDVLIEDLKKGEYEVRLKAAWALGRFQDVRAIEELQAVLVDDHRNIRGEAAEALDELGWQPSTDGETSLYLYARREWDDLAAMGLTAIEAIILALKDADVRSSILSALNEAHVPLNDRRVVKLLVDIFDSEDTIDHRRQEVIRVLARTGVSQAINPLIRIYMTEESEYFTKPAFEAIGYLASSRVPVAKKVIQILTKKGIEEFDDAEIQSYLKLFTIVPATKKQIETFTIFLNSVIARKVKKVTRIAKDLLRIAKLSGDVIEGNRARKVKAVNTIGKKKLPSGAYPLIHALRDEFPGIRMDAVKFLGQIEKGILSLLLDALYSKILRVRFGAIEAIGLNRDNRAARPLLDTFEDPHPSIRQKVAWALSNLHIYRDRHRDLRADILSALEKAMISDNYTPVRINATYSLAEMAHESWKDFSAVKPLLRALSEPEDNVRSNAALGFMNCMSKLADNPKLRAKVVEKLIPLLSDEVDKVRYNAVYALRFSCDATALTSLKAAVCKDDEKMRELVDQAISELEKYVGKTRSSWHRHSGYHTELGFPDDIDRLIEALSDEHKMVRGNAAWTLAELKDKRAFKALLKATKDEYWVVRAYAAAAVAIIRGRGALEALLRLLEDEHWRVRYIVTDNLHKFKSQGGLPALKKQLKDDDERVRDIAKIWYDGLAKKWEKK